MDAVEYSEITIYYEGKIIQYKIYSLYFHKNQDNLDQAQIFLVFGHCQAQLKLQLQLH